MEVSRRSVVRLAGLTAFGAAGLTTGCDRNERADVHAAAIIGVQVGEKLCKFPFPVIRIIGVMLEVAGVMTIVAVKLADFTEEEIKIDLDFQEANDVKADRSITAVRADGKTEKVLVNEIIYDRSSPAER